MLFRSVLQVIRKYFWWSSFEKVAGCSLTKIGLYQRFYSMKIRNFFRTAFSWNNFRWMLLFRELPLWSPIKVASIWFTKYIKTFASSQSYFVKQLSGKKNLEHSSKKCPWWTSWSCWSRVSTFFLKIFNFLQSLWRPHANNFF